MILDAEENLGRQISSLFPAKRASDRDRLEGKLSDSGGYVTSASFASDDESLPGWRRECHVKIRIGENKANVDVQRVQAI